MTVNNSLFVIAPYWDSDTWVFDDERRGLLGEPFVSGVPDMIDYLVDSCSWWRRGRVELYLKHGHPVLLAA